MSVEAITWALRQPVPVSSAKFVLVVLANCASADTGVAFPSIAYLVESTGQDRKTVAANLKRLIELGLIEDTGERAGRTRQIVIYRLGLGSSPLERTPKTEPLHGQESIPNPGVFQGAENPAESSPKTEQYQKRNSTVFPSKEAQFSPERGPKTVHGTVNNHQEPSSLSRADADACAREATDEQARTAVVACIALRKLGMRVQPAMPPLLALVADGATVEQMALTASELALRTAHRWNDPDQHPELPELFASGATATQMGLHDHELAALRACAPSIQYLAATLRGRAADAQREQSDGKRFERAGAGSPRRQESAAERAERKRRAGEARDDEHDEAEADDGDDVALA